jgi:hypothetical protein
MLFSLVLLVLLFGLLSAGLLVMVNAKLPAELSITQNDKAPFLVLGGLLAVTALAAAKSFFLSKRSQDVFFAVVICVAIINLYFMYAAVPAIENFRPFKPLGEKIAVAVEPGDRVASYHFFSRGLMYYTGGREIDVVRGEKELINYLSAPGRAFVAMYDNEWKGLASRVVGRAYFRANHGVIITNFKP